MNLEQLTWKELADYNAKELKEVTDSYSGWVQTAGNPRISLREYMVNIYFPQNPPTDFYNRYMIRRTDTRMHRGIQR